MNQPSVPASLSNVSPGSFSTLFQGYRPAAGSFDEAIWNGQLRPHWLTFVRHLDRIGTTELQRRWDQAQRQMSAEGLTFRPQDLGEGKSRPWVLDAVPLLMKDTEWKPIAAGLIQRARLYEFILSDLFGAQHLLRDRLLPPEALYAHPNYFPAYHGLVHPGKKFLELFAADLSRAADGKWIVTGDRSRAPFGLGYLLENRIVTSRNLPQAFRQCRVLRLAPFFMVLKETLRSLATRGRDNPRIVLWTKGPSSPAYVEDAYLARYLGYTLAEGDDLAVRENRVMLKSLGGLLPVEVLLRRLDDDECDPVELDTGSSRGIAGLVEVIRSNHVAVSNSLGSRLIESPIFFPYVAEICRRFLGEELVLPSVATWWCGEPSACDYVLRNLMTLLIRPAYRTYDYPAIHPAQIPQAELQQLTLQIRANPGAFVGQEIPQRSTTPVLSDGKLVPWAIALRGFVAAGNVSENRSGYTALPSALARISPNPLALDQTMTSGERSQDVWIISDLPVEEVSLLKASRKSLVLRRSSNDFPSRVADNLFWLGQNLERAEAKSRLLRTTLLRLTDERERIPELPMLLRALAERGQLEPGYVIEDFGKRMPDIAEILPDSLFAPNQPLNLRSTIREIVRIASLLRDRLSIDMWRIIQRIDATSQRRPASRKIDPAEGIQLLDQMITELVALAGLAAESMTRTQAWRFLDLGRRLERVEQTAALCQTMLCARRVEEDGIMEALLLTLDSLMTYRSRYLASLQMAPVVDLVISDETNPRSVGYQVAVIVDHVEQLPRNPQEAARSTEQRYAMAMQNAIRLADVRLLVQANKAGDRPRLSRLLKKIQMNQPKLAGAISGKFLIHAGQQQHFAGRAEDVR